MRPLAGAVLLIVLAPAAPVRAALTEAPRLAAVYDAILAADFPRAGRMLRESCPRAPEGACAALAAVASWWRILADDPLSREGDQRLLDATRAAIQTNDAWTRREPARAEAWFYLAGSYAPLVQWRVLRGQRLAAARDGTRIKRALERALALDPTIEDAHFGIGLYHYYAAVAPAPARFLRWLLLLPGGDRAQGLREMRRARERGTLLTGEADYQRHLIDLWYEGKPGEALALLRGLDARYPSNPLFLARIAEVESGYRHDHPASAAAWRGLLDRAARGAVHGAAAAGVRARLGLAAELDAMFETDRAIDLLQEVADRRPPDPAGATSRAELQLGEAYDRIGERARAEAAYRAALADAPSDDPEGLRDRARAGLRRQPDPRAAEAYRVSLEGWRALPRDPARAARLLDRARTLAPSDPMVRYRYARSLEARGDRDHAGAELDALIAARPAAPPIVLASAYVARAQQLEASGDRPRARTMYERARDLTGGASRARDRAREAIERLDGLTRNF